jgi:hypothetical protein
LCQECSSLFLNETCVSSSTNFRNLLMNKFNMNFIRVQGVFQMILILNTSKFLNSGN